MFAGWVPLQRPSLVRKEPGCGIFLAQRFASSCLCGPGSPAFVPRSDVVLISRVTIGNHSRIADLDLEIRGHAVIVGANDVGKTSILQAAGSASRVDDRAVVPAIDARRSRRLVRRASGRGRSGELLGRGAAPLPARDQHRFQRSFGVPAGPDDRRRGPGRCGGGYDTALVPRSRSRSVTVARADRGVRLAVPARHARHRRGGAGRGAQRAARTAEGY